MKFLDLFKGILNKFNSKFKKQDKKQIFDMEDLDVSQREEYLSQLELTSNLEKNIALIKELFGSSFDLNVRRFKLGSEELDGALIYMSSLVDKKNIEKILNTLEIDLLKFQSFSSEGQDVYQTAFDRLLNNANVKEVKKLKKISNDLPQGYSVLLFSEIPRAILCETKGYQTRNIEEPKAEKVIRGPRDGFVEDIFTNTSLLRRRIRAPHLWFESLEIGSLSQTKVAMAYIKGLASEELVEEVKSRLDKIDLDTVLESGYLQEYITDEPFSIFPLIERTERPDKVVSCLVEGKVAILTQGTPFVLILPATFDMFLQSPDDYYENFIVTSFVRFMRYVAYILSVLLPGIYVAVLNFHQELLPASLFLRVIGTREGVPFPVFVEALIMGILFEFLREAGLRLPEAVGSAISIVGALVLGEAAINASLASPSMVVIVAITAISSFTVPRFAFGFTARVIRFAFLLFGGTIGMFGIQFGILVVLIHLCSLRSFGQPYFQPYAPLIWQDLKDSMVRFPWYKMISRPLLLGQREPQRQAEDQNPEPPEEGE